MEISSSIMKNIGVGFLISAILGPVLIPWLRKLKIGQTVREEGPQSHLKKNGTPTMGGLIFFFSLLITSFLLGYIDKEYGIILLSAFAFGLIGFIDDYIIVVRKDNKGLKPYQKLLGQFVFAFILAYYQYKTSNIGGGLKVPFLKDVILNLGMLYIPFIAFVTVGTVNSVNLTDGLDGLASSVTIIVLVFFAYAGNFLANPQILNFSTVLIGALLGFLLYNFYPAKTFMGDTGSMTLGGAVAALAVTTDLTLFIPIVGAIYFIEALSVIIQVVSYKTRKKRVFLMSPLHHHYEEKGWKETKVVLSFIGVSILFIIIGIIGLK